MASDLITSIKEAEKNAEKFQIETESKVKEIIEKAKKETEGIKDAKLKEETKKATLRVNIAKSDASRICKDKKNQAEEEIKKIKSKVELKKNEAIDLILDFITR